MDGVRSGSVTVTAAAAAAAITAPAAATATTSTVAAAAAIPTVSAAAAAAAAIPTVSAAAAATAATAAASTESAAATTTTTGGALFTRTGNVHGQCTTTKVLPVEKIHGLLRLVRRAEFNEGKSPGLASELVEHEVNTRNHSSSAEVILDVAVHGLVRQIAHEEPRIVVHN